MIQCVRGEAWDGLEDEERKGPSRGSTSRSSLRSGNDHIGVMSHLRVKWSLITTTYDERISEVGGGTNGRGGWVPPLPSS